MDQSLHCEVVCGIFKYITNLMIPAPKTQNKKYCSVTHETFCRT